MKKQNSYLLILLLLTLFFNSCNEDEIIDPFPSELVEGCYVVNFGNYGSGGASISKYDYTTDELTNFYYQQQNNGNELLSNIQFAYPYNDSIFLIGNATDLLITVNPFMKQTKNGVSDKIANPRYCVASGDYLYISCLGANPDWMYMPDSYIAKFNIKSNSVEKVINLPGGPEGLEIARGKLFAALNYKDSIAVIDLGSEKITYIATPAVTSYFVKDNSENLYVTLVSTFTNMSEETGIGFINTSTEQLAETYALANVSSGYGSVIQANADFSKIYVIASSYDANWNLTGAVSEFNVNSKAFSASPAIKDITGISGISVNPVNDQIYVLSATSTTGVGTLGIYSATGDFIKDYAIGAFPVGAFYLD